MAESPQLSVLEQIAQNVLATVASLTLAMPDGTTPTFTVARPTVVMSPVHLTGYLFQSPADRIDEAAVGTDEWMQQFGIVAYVIPLETDPTPVDQYNNAIYAALYKALMVDYTRGGPAYNTVVQGPLFFPPVSGEANGLTFNFEVQYRNRQDDPFAAAT